MFKRSLLTLAMLIITLPVFAGELENAFTQNDNVFLYLYSSTCGYCTKFNPIYEKLKKNYNTTYAFVKLNVNTYYGHKIYRAYNGRFVPYVLLLNQKKNRAIYINPNCLLEYSCITQEVNKFRT